MINEEIYRNLLEQREYKIGFAELFASLGLLRIAIFGCGEVGILFSKELLRLGVDLRYFVDNSYRGTIGDIDVITPKELKTKTDVDAIIIALNERAEYFYISRQLKDFYGGVIMDIAGIMRICSTVHYAEQYRNISGNSLNVICVQLYTLMNLENVSVAESLTINRHFGNVGNRMALYEYSKDSIEDENIDIHEYLSIISLRKPDTAIINNSITNVDFKSKYVNSIGGKRFTPDMPSKYRHTVHLIGSSTAFSVGVEDKYSIANFMQRKLNTVSENTYRVVTHGMRGVQAFCEMQIHKLSHEKFINEGDTVVFVVDSPSRFISHNRPAFVSVENFMKGFFEGLNFKYLSSFNILNELHLQENLFVDDRHFSFRGNLHLAEQISALVNEMNICTCGDPINPERMNDLHLRQTDDTDNDELNDYIKSIKVSGISGRIGSIVVNCNPFTNGHRYIIEKASEAVDFLYVFVVEEDKSNFPFATRIDLVKAGVSDIMNCTVVPSGRLIISTKTFPEYFSKDSLVNASVDCGLDISIFAGRIAPALGITVRFAGEEPFCNITRQYNDFMRNLLPNFGIEFVELKRLESGNNPISASYVRKLLQEKDFGAIKRVVPKTTFDYLLKEFS